MYIKICSLIIQGAGITFERTIVLYEKYQFFYMKSVKKVLVQTIILLI